MKEEKGVFDYSFKCVNITDFELSMTYHARGELMNHVFSKSKKMLMRKGVNAVGSPDDVSYFDVPQRFLGLIRTISGKQIREVEKIIRKDKIELLSYVVSGARFKKNEKKDWDIIIKISGTYIDKR